MSLNFSDPAVFKQLPHDSRADATLAISFSSISVATVVLILRLYTRVCVTRQNGIDDYLITAALFLAWAFGVGVYLGVRKGFGTHVWDLYGIWGPETVLAAGECLYIAFNFYIGALVVTRMGLLAQYYRIIAVQKMRTICLVVTFLVGSISLALLAIAIFQCTPIHKLWNPSIPGSCIHEHAVLYSNAVGNIVTDLMVFILPLPVVFNLNLPSRHKLILLGVLCLGFFTVIISVLRLRYLNQSDDLFYTTAPAAYWSCIEMCSGIVCASLVTLGPLAEKWLPWLVGNARSQQRSYPANDLESTQKIHPTQSELSANDSRIRSRPDMYGKDDIDGLAHYSKQSWGSIGSEKGIILPSKGSKFEDFPRESR